MTKPTSEDVFLAFLNQPMPERRLNDHQPSWRNGYRYGAEVFDPAHGDGMHCPACRAVVVAEADVDLFMNTGEVVVRIACPKACGYNGRVAASASNVDRTTVRRSLAVPVVGR